MSGIGATGINEEYNPATDTWTTKAPMPNGIEIADLPATVVHGFIYIFDYYETYSYSPLTDTWNRYLSEKPTMRSRYGIGVLNDHIYIIGGSVPAVGIPLDVNEEYDPATDAWTTVSQMPSFRTGCGAATIGNKIYVIGGRDPWWTYLGTNEEFTFEQDTYRYYIHRKN